MSPGAHGPATLYLVSPEPAPGVSLLQVEGELSSNDAPRWATALAAAIEGDGVPTIAVIVDLRGCSFLAQACMGELLTASDSLADLGRDRLRVLVDIGEPMAQAIWTGGQNRLSFHSSTARALEALGNP